MGCSLFAGCHCFFTKYKAKLGLHPYFVNGPKSYRSLVITSHGNIEALSRFV
jgi:hypothetical protein